MITIVYHIRKEHLEYSLYGDRKYKIPVLDPMFIKELRVHHDTGSRAIGFGFVATDCILRGLKGLVVEEIKGDVKKDRYEYYLRVPKLEIMSKYNVTGRVLILPISGSGDAKMTFEDIRLAYKYNIGLKHRNGANYSVIRNPVFEFDVRKRMTINLDNLFNGDQLLGKQMNRFLNENWKEVLLDVGPIIADTIGQITTRILGEIFNLVPYEDAFLP